MPAPTVDRYSWGQLPWGRIPPRRLRLLVHSAGTIAQAAKKQRRNSALISQSGAFIDQSYLKNPWLDPAYMTALGNQSDITHGDMLNYYADNGDIDIIGVYVEGFNES